MNKKKAMDTNCLIMRMNFLPPQDLRANAFQKLLARKTLAFIEPFFEFFFGKLSVGSQMMQRLQ
jgi:hypothetical protein